MKRELHPVTFFEWMKENSHEVGFPHLAYFYSDGGVDAKRFLERLIYLTGKTDWGWTDNWIEFNSAATFASEAQAYRSKIEDAQRITLEPYSSSEERLKYLYTLPWVILALFDVERLADNSADLDLVLDICKALAERNAIVLLTGASYPSEAFKAESRMARFLLNGYVAKIEDNRIIFEGERPALAYDLPFYGLLEYGFDCPDNEPSRFSVNDCDELLFQWELLCTWRMRYGLFDFDLFKDAFVGAWRFFLTKPLREDCQKMSDVRIRLLSLMSGFNGGPIHWKLCLFNDDGPMGDGVPYGDSSQLTAADAFVLELVEKELTDELHKGDGMLRFSFPIGNDKTKFHADKRWEASVSLPEFQEAIADLVSELKEAQL